MSTYLTTVISEYISTYKVLSFTKYISLTVSFDYSVDSALHVLNYMRNLDGSHLVNHVPMVCNYISFNIFSVSFLNVLPDNSNLLQDSRNMRTEFLVPILCFPNNEARNCAQVATSGFTEMIEIATMKNMTV